MGENSKISWCSSTFNPWIGCTKVSDGCKFCYAERQDSLYKWTEQGFGKGKPRSRTSKSNWSKPIAWARNAVANKKKVRIFCASLADVFDPEVPTEWKQDLFNLIDTTGQIGGVEWLLLTKRIEYATSDLPEAWRANPPDYVRLGITVESQPNAHTRIPILLDIWKGKNFLSVEPMLGPIKLFGFGSPLWGKIPESKYIHWVICGGESGHGCRPLKTQDAIDLLYQCQAHGIPFFFKQMGGYPDKRDDPQEWPIELLVQEFPGWQP